MHTKRVKEINDNSPLKTDDKDPRVIADIIKLGRALSIVIPEGDAAYLRRLNNSRERHVRERTALVNQLQQLVFLLFPEFRKVIKDIKCKTPLYLLKKYPTPEAISVLDKHALGEEMRKQSRGKFREQPCGHADQSCQEYRRYQRRRFGSLHGHKTYPRSIGDAKIPYCRDRKRDGDSPWEDTL